MHLLYALYTMSFITQISGWMSRNISTRHTRTTKQMQLRRIHPFCVPSRKHSKVPYHNIFTSHWISQFNLCQKHPNGEADKCVFSELYNSDMFYDEHDNVQCAPSDKPTCKRERVIAALMFWSDAMHLATFSTTKMWPVYMLFFGNLSKYIQFQPNSGATKHLIS
jgi:hypothetical protein